MAQEEMDKGGKREEGKSEGGNAQNDETNTEQSESKKDNPPSESTISQPYEELVYPLDALEEEYRKLRDNPDKVPMPPNLHEFDFF